MGWQDLLSGPSGLLAAPWLGGRRIFSGIRSWRVEGDLPREFGFYEWRTLGRKASLVCEAEFDSSLAGPSLMGYLVGDRFVDVDSRAADPGALIENSEQVYLVEPGLDRFAIVRVVCDPEDRHIYQEELFPLGPEEEVRRAFIDRKDSVAHIKGVVPALDLAFRFATWQRELAEKRRAELARIREEERRREEAMRSIGTGIGRRTLAAHDFEAAARAALSVGGAELLDVRDGRTRNESVVQYLFQNRRLECVADKRTLRIISSGVCLTDERTGEKGDTWLTLESLPSVIGEALRRHRLVVYRHVDGEDPDYEDY